METAAPIVLPVLETASLIKIVTWIKMILKNYLKIEVSGYASWILTAAVAVIWKVGEGVFSGGGLNLTAILPAIQLALQAMFGFAAANSGILGAPAKSFATKPLL